MLDTFFWCKNGDCSIRLNPCKSPLNTQLPSPPQIADAVSGQFAQYKTRPLDPVPQRTPIGKLLAESPQLLVISMFRGNNP